MTSSLRNSIHRRNHKERSQLAHRSKLGILEKHADYVKRAQDYHSKQNRLTRLKQKAVERNKDEFYFSMKNEKTKASRATACNSYIIILFFLYLEWCTYKGQGKYCPSNRHREGPKNTGRELYTHNEDCRSKSLFFPSCHTIISQLFVRKSISSKAD